jgi:hypothetical protein
MFELFLLGIPAALVATVVLCFRAVVKRDERAWSTHEVVMVDAPGAYRDVQKRPGVVERLRETPSELKVTALFALVFGVMWFPSLPLVAVGALVELDGAQGKPGLATLFGLPGIALSVAHLVLGLRFTRRGAKSRDLARGVAIWSTVHNLALLGFVGFVSVSDRLEEVHRIARLDALGPVVVLYALLSIGFAWYAWRTAKLHERLDELDSSVMSAVGAAPIVPPIEAPVVAYGEAPPYP